MLESFHPKAHRSILLFYFEIQMINTDLRAATLSFCQMLKSVLILLTLTLLVKEKNKSCFSVGMKYMNEYFSNDRNIHGKSI